MTLLGDVFVAGGQPTITYQAREDLGLERAVSDFLDERHKILAVTGPSKAGKTVLLKSTLADCDVVWAAGGRISVADDLWRTIVDQLALHEEETEVETSGMEQEFGDSLEAGINIGVRGAKRSDRSERFQSSTGETRRRSRPLLDLAVDGLRDMHPILIIDDFHYVGRKVQEGIIRSLKDLLFEGLQVIVATVPHRALDAVRANREMTGRLTELAIPVWSSKELSQIGWQGFEALKVHDPLYLTERLSAEAVGSPHLMQDFCFQLCKQNGIRESGEPRELNPPPDWRQFFRFRARTAERAAFDRLSRGRAASSERKQRRLRRGGTADVYQVVLEGIARNAAKFGPNTGIRYEDIEESLRTIVVEDVPKKHEVTRALEEMARVAVEEIEGEPVVYWDSELQFLHVADPFFIFYLRWAVF